MTLKIIDRASWGGVIDRSYYRSLTLPVPFVLFHHRSKELLTDQPTCAKEVRQVLNADINKLKIKDVRYNFMIGFDGGVYECRGWQVWPMLPQRVLHSLDGLCIYIGLTGVYTVTGYPRKMLKAKDELLNFAVENNYLTKDYIEYETL